VFDERGSREDLAEGLRVGREMTKDWPDSTFVVRGDSRDSAILAYQLESNPHPAYWPPMSGWSVQSRPDASVIYLCQRLLSSNVRVTTLGDLRRRGGYLAKTPGGHEHCTVGGIDPGTFDGILSKPQRNSYGPK
jgi:hypothetical protein